jgi:hypothetical protein
MAQPWVNSEARVNEVYQPLDTSSTQIRVAILQPRQSADTYVVVSLQTVSLSDSPQFDALSWVWGDPKDVRPIILEGELWWAPKNLVIALEHLRPESAPRVIWIDALCINQSETTAGLAERGHQIGLMRRIYTTANRVLVWMGLEREWTKGVLSLLTDVADNAQDFGDEPPSLPRPYHVPYTESWKVLHLLSEPWWDRVWVLQEVGLAKEAVLYHGIHSMPFTKALRAINLLESRHHLPGKGPEFETKLGPFNNLYSDGLSFRLPKTSFSPLYPRENVFALFISLMVACRFRSATNPRDKVFGLFGLAPDLVLQALQPRYDEPVEKIYVRTAYILMNETHSLSLLSHTTPWKRYDSKLTLPSWVPDWTIRSNTNFLYAPDHLSDKPLYVPSQLNQRIHFSVQDGRYLRVDGILIDSIAKRGHGYSGFWRFMDWSKHRRMLSRLCANELPDVLENDLEYMKEHKWDAFGQCLSITYIATILEAASLILFGFLRWIDHVCDKLRSQMFRERNQNALRRRACVERDFEVMRTNKHMKQYLRENPERQVPDPIFTTDDGFVGLGPVFLEPRDQIFVVAGAIYPLIFRKSPATRSRYTYIGECYLAGIMQGEATAESFASWRRRKRRLVPEAERQLDDEQGIWEEVVLE